MKPASEWRLGQRQAQLLELLADGIDGQQAVAQRLGVTLNTVGQMLKDIKSKASDHGETPSTMGLVVAWDRHRRGESKPAVSTLKWPKIEEQA